MITPEQIAAATGAPPANIAASWPKILAALTFAGMPLESTQIAAIATIHVECPTFLPMREKYNGDPAVYFARYDNNPDLGNIQPGDGQRFCGRGFIQLTGRANYLKYGGIVGADLIADPDLALDDDIASKVLAAYFLNHHIDTHASSGDWKGVRRIVNGGLTGIDKFMACVEALEAE